MSMGIIESGEYNKVAGLGGSGTVASGNGTCDTSLISDENFLAHWVRKGDVITLRFRFRTLVEINSDTAGFVITDLPKPVEDVLIAGLTQSHDAFGAWFLTTEGKLRAHFVAPADTWNFGTVTYLTSD